MQKIIPHLWFDTEAKEATQFYTSLFDDSQIKSVITLHNTPSGDADIITILLSGQEFMLLNAGPYFKFTPAISFFIACKTKEEVEVLWNKLSDRGTALMELGEYPFSEKYGWIQDRYGLSWQIMYRDQSVQQKITPTLMYVGGVAGKAEEAINFYISVFKQGSINSIMRYEKGEDPEREGTIKHMAFSLQNQHFAAMDSAQQHNFSFNEAISFVVKCETQEEIDYYWDKLSADPSAEQCGWLKDRYGVSWQIVPKQMDGMMLDTDQTRLARVTEAFLQMKKFNIKELEKAYQGK